MTKFEEEAMKELAKSEYVYTAYDGTFRGETDGTVMEFAKGTTIYTFPWLEFAKNWHSNEEYQELLKENNKLKSQLQQQALPVVPECVAVQIERVKNSNGNFATLGLFDWNHEAKPDYTKWIHENVFDFMRACTIGYTVEKPQLFYLKNKIELEDVGSDLIGYLNLFLTNGGYLTNNINRAKKFTKQEIDQLS